MRRRLLGTALFVLLASVASVLLIIVIAVTPRKDVPAAPQPSCALETLRELFANVNLTSEPCADFSGFVCSRRQQRGPREAVRLRYLENVVYPTLQGAREDKASRAIYVLHRSCVRHLLDPSTTPETIWGQMVDALRSFSSADQLDPLHLVGLLDIRYNVGAFLRSSVTSPWSRTMTLKLKPAMPSMPLLSDSGRLHRKLLGRLLAFLRLSLNVSTTAEGLDRLVGVMTRSFLENGTAEESGGKISLLSEYLPKASFNVWMDSLKAVCACNRVVYADVKIYDAKLFAALIDLCSGREYRDEVLAYAIASASAKLFEKWLAASAGWDSPTRVDVCTSWVLNVHHIWDVVTIERHSDRAKDKILKSLFDATVKAAAKGTEILFAPVGDATELRRFLSRLALLYPRKVSDLYADLLPKFESGEHVRNSFAVREYFVRTLAMDAALDLDDKRIWKAGTLGPLVTISSRYVFFSPSIYSEMRTECGPTNSGFLNAHLIAVHLADSLVQKIHAEATRGAFGGVVAPESLGCLDDVGGHVVKGPPPAGLLQCPLLALRIVARAMPFDQWRHQSAELGAWNVTHSRVFFMLLYLSEICTPSDLPRKSGTASFLLRLPEFRESFGCHPPMMTPTDTATPSSPSIVNGTDNFLP
ncbi:hypothetical protein HPB49_017709 [Dermacentor silvarum]|uniref:Uncharacterized protein n=1 Tax=Dermacentor silvarum TaxID=543639 RepID=A0ACB8CGN1_DERSI|nr:hypothetical protein HPB49_017709 [Dermacentor silvarum]